ncbi:MAG: GNAT family N-acetyltransferase [Granulosicoccus sp.]|nr:GNAT family N-acetyltransferase [Granulosicoccus sp.]
MSDHFLQSLFEPASIVIAGASPREGSVGSRLVNNILSGGYKGKIWLVNSRYRTMFDLKAYRSIRTLPECPDLAILVTPEATLERMISNCAERGIKVALVMTMSHQRQALSEHAANLGVRLIGPGSAGLIRPALSLNATYSDNQVAKGPLAVCSHSATLASAVIDWADSNQIGFSALVSTGSEIDVGMSDLLEYLSQDFATKAIIIYLDRVRHSRRFISAIAEAARNKPVLLMKSTQDSARFCDVRTRSGEVYSSDRVFQAALDRAGVVRIRTFSNLFAAARILASGARTRGKRIAIVSNGAAPAMLACERVQAKGFDLPALPATLIEELTAHMQTRWSGVNPMVVRDYEHMSAVFPMTAEAALASDLFDAVLCIHVPDNWCDPLELAEKIANLPNPKNKPLLTCWMGEKQVNASRAYFREAGILNFRTPEAATDAFDFLYRHFRNQKLLLQLPDPVSSPEPVDFKQARQVVRTALDQRIRVLPIEQSLTLLANLGIPNRQPASPSPHSRDLALRVFHDPTFGPVLSLGIGGDLMTLIHNRPVQLPPLNGFLIADMLHDEHLGKYLGQFGHKRPAAVDALTAVLQRVSDLICEIPEIYEIEINPLRVDDIGVNALSAVVAVQRSSASSKRYEHLAIHPYPRDWIRHCTLKNNEQLTLRPIRPEDGDGIAQLVHNMSPEARYMRFMHAMESLPPRMIAQFTKIDYDRQMAFCALPADGSLVGVARYSINPDGTSSEFAIAIADDWQRQGLSTRLMQLLIEHARDHDLHSISGEVLTRNQPMRGLMESMGFKCNIDPESPEQLICTLPLKSDSPNGSDDTR